MKCGDVRSVFARTSPLVLIYFSGSMIRLRKPVSFGIAKLSDYVAGKPGAVFTHDSDCGFFLTSQDAVEIARTDYKNVVLTDDCISITGGAEETFSDGKDGRWIGNYYDYRSFRGDGSHSVSVVLEELPETNYGDATYVFVVEGTIDGGGVLAATGNPKSFSFGGQTFRYVTYKGNLLEAANDDISFTGYFAASFTGRYAERWLQALAGNSFLCDPTTESCVAQFDVSINDGRSTVTSLVPVRNVYLANCQMSRAYPNVNYEVIGDFYGSLMLFLYEPDSCQLPYRFLIRNLYSTNGQCMVQKYSGNGGEAIDVMWLTSDRMEKGATYLLTVQHMVARLEKVIG